jgi:hypothetical protein
MRRIPDVPKGGWLLDGKRYESEAEYLGALDKRNDRRARALARISVERGELLTAPAVVDVEAVRRYYERFRDESGDGSTDPNVAVDSGFVPPRPTTTSADGTV